jgi:hypothetical protein
MRFMMIVKSIAKSQAARPTSRDRGGGIFDHLGQVERGGHRVAKRCAKVCPGDVTETEIKPGPREGMFCASAS